MTSELHVIFGAGPLALAVMQELVARGKAVRMINRSGKAKLPEGVQLRTGDAYTQAKELSAGASVIYQCAQPRYTTKDWLRDFPPLQKAILDAAEAHQAKLIMGDNLYMYASSTQPLREDMPYAATTQKGQLRAKLAQMLLDAHAQGRVRTAMGRGADFFGPHALGSSMGERVFPQILAGKAAAPMGNIDMPHTYTYIADFGKALVILGEREEALGKAWHVPNAPTLTTRQFLTIAFELAGKEPQFSPMGRMMMRIGGLFIPEAKSALEMFHHFEQPYVVDHSQFAQAFGDHATPTRDALQATLDWYKQH